MKIHIIQDIKCGIASQRHDRKIALVIVKSEEYAPDFHCLIFETIILHDEPKYAAEH